MQVIHINICAETMKTTTTTLLDEVLP